MFEGAPIPKLWDLGQTKAPVGIFTYIWLNSMLKCRYSICHSHGWYGFLMVFGYPTFPSMQRKVMKSQFHPSNPFRKIETNPMIFVIELEYAARATD